MTPKDVVQIYAAVAMAYLIMWAFKLTRRKGGVSGWTRLKIKAEKQGVMTPENFASTTVLMIFLMAFAWPIVLVDTLIEKKK